MCDEVHTIDQFIFVNQCVKYTSLQFLLKKDILLIKEFF